MRKNDVIKRIKQELRTIRDVPLYINKYKFPEIVDEIERKLIENLSTRASSSEEDSVS